jgi:hypothetical protein
MPQRKPPKVSMLGTSSTPGRELLERFTGRNGGFEVPSKSSFRRHEQWRNLVLRELKVLEAEGLLVVLQLVPCKHHGKCAGQPVAAGCELTLKGQKIRGLPAKSRSRTVGPESSFL